MSHTSHSSARGGSHVSGYNNSDYSVNKSHSSHNNVAPNKEIMENIKSLNENDNINKNISEDVKNVTSLPKTTRL